VARRSDEQALLVKQFAGGASDELWLDWSLTPPDRGDEDRLSILAGWIMAADEQQARYGLRLPGQQIAPGPGHAHRASCLQALALYGESGAGWAASRRGARTRCRALAAGGALATAGTARRAPAAVAIAAGRRRPALASLAVASRRRQLPPRWSLALLVIAPSRHRLAIPQPVRQGRGRRHAGPLHGPQTTRNAQPARRAGDHHARLFSPADPLFLLAEHSHRPLAADRDARC
jgi:hypothetical protein